MDELELELELLEDFVVVDEVSVDVVLVDVVLVEVVVFLAARRICLKVLGMPSRAKRA